MRFEWDSKKNESNIDKHSISFLEASTVFDDKNILSKFDKEHSENEDRWISLGFDKMGKLLVVCHTFNILESKEVVRIISARQANKREQEYYNARRK